MMFRRAFTRLRAFPGFRSVCILLMGATSGTAPAVESQDLSDLPLEVLMEIEVPTVFGASKFEQKVTAAPSSISVITADEIRRYGHRTLGDVLESVQGFHVSYDRNYAIVGVRGVSLGDFNSRILLLINGHRVNNNLTDGAFIDTAFILDVDLIERVEIIRGPGSVLYGNNAFFGVVNVITRQPAQLNGTEVSADYGGFETWKARVSFGKEFSNGFRMLLSGTFYESSGDDRLFYPQFNTPGQNRGIAEDLDSDQFGSLFGSIAFGDFTLEGSYIRREKENPTAQFLSAFNQAGLRTVDERAYTALRYSHQFDDGLALTARLYYDRNDFSIGYPLVAATSTNVTRERQAGEWWGTEIQVSKKLWDRHMVSLGAEYRDDFRQEKAVLVPGGTQISLDRRSYGFYAQTDFEIQKNLHLSGGVRYDKYGDTDGAVNPRLAAIYNAWEGSSFKAVYGTAFRAPNFRELSDPNFRDLQPETISAYELIFEQEITRTLRSSISGFWNEMDDLISFQAGEFRNFDARAQGVELAMDGAWTNGIRTRLSYTLQNAEDRANGSHLPDSPNHLVKCALSIPLVREKLFAALEFHYQSARHSIFTGTAPGESTVGRDAAGYGIVNFTLFSQNLIENLEASASIYNLLDRKYNDPASRFHRQDLIEQDGRSFRLKLTYRF